MRTISMTMSDHRPLVFILLIGLIFLIAVGHLPIIADATSIVFGLPVWLWVQISVIVVLLGLAWIATGLLPIEERS